MEKTKNVFIFVLRNQEEDDLDTIFPQHKEKSRLASSSQNVSNLVLDGWRAFTIKKIYIMRENFNWDAFDRWLECEGTTDLARNFKGVAKEEILKNIEKFDGEVDALMYISTTGEDCDDVEGTVTFDTLEEFITDALDDMEDDISGALNSSSILILTCGSQKVEVDMTEYLMDEFEKENNKK